MDFSIILAALVAKFPALLIVFTFLGLFVVVGQAVVLLTPSTKDDAAWDRIKQIPILGALLVALAAFAPIHKK